MRKPIAADALSGLIGSIYDCALEPGRWPDTLSRLHRELDFANASLSLIAVPAGEILLNILTGPAPAWMEIAPRYGADVIDQWGGPEKIQCYPLGEPLVLSQVRDRSLWESGRFFQEWGRPQGIHDTMTIGLARDSTMIGSLGLGRHDSAGEIGYFEVEAARLLAPHLVRAVAISKLLDLKSIVASTFETTLDTLSVAVALTDADLRIVHANDAAQALLSIGDPIYAKGGVLAARPPAAAAALGVAVRQAADNEAAIGKRGFSIPAPRIDGAPCVLHVLPLKHGELRPGLAPAAVAAVFVAPAVSPAPTPNEALAALFDLTAAETRVFAHIAAGMTQSEIADKLGVETGTVKTHLLRVFTKTGTRRQADLVKLAASLALPLQ